MGENARPANNSGANLPLALHAIAPEPSMPSSSEPTFTDSTLSFGEFLPVLKERAQSALRTTGEMTIGLARIVKSLGPLIELLNADEDVTEQQLHVVIKTIVKQKIILSTYIPLHLVLHQQHNQQL